MMVREAPLHAGHVRNVLSVTEMGRIIHSPVPAFYTEPKTIDDIVNHSLGYALDCFGLDLPRWGEPVEVEDDKPAPQPVNLMAGRR